MKLISARNLGFSFKSAEPLIREVSVDIDAGDIVCIVGRSGIGKSTLLRLLAGELTPTAGEISRGTENGPAHGIVMHHQDALLLPWLTVSQNVWLGCRTGRHKPRIDAQALIDRLALTALIHRYPAFLSGGQVERVALGRSLLTPGSVYLLDEPLSGTDYERRVLIEEYLREQIVGATQAVVLVTHDLPQAVALGTKVLVFNQRGAAASTEAFPLDAEFGAIGPRQRRESTAFGPIVAALTTRLRSHAPA